MWLFRMLLEALEYVLLWGGKERIFEPKDSDIIMDDLLELQAFFTAKDETGVAQGLPENIVAGHSTHVKTIIANLMEWSTDFLIEQYNSAPSTLASMQILSKQNILAVLIHRTDTSARTFIRSHKLTSEYKAIKKGSHCTKQRTEIRLEITSKNIHSYTCILKYKNRI